MFVASCLGETYAFLVRRETVVRPRGNGSGGANGSPRREVKAKQKMKTEGKKKRDSRERSGGGPVTHTQMSATVLFGAPDHLWRWRGW